MEWQEEKYEAESDEWDAQFQEGIEETPSIADSAPANPPSNQQQQNQQINNPENSKPIDSELEDNISFDNMTIVQRPIIPENIDEVTKDLLIQERFAEIAEYQSVCFFMVPTNDIRVTM